MGPRLYREMAVMNAVTVIAAGWVAVRDSSWWWALIAAVWFGLMLSNLAEYRKAR